MTRDSVQFYDDVAPLVSELGRIMCVALDQGHAAVCIATEPSRVALRSHLANRGIDVAAFRSSGQCVFLDAARVLSDITTDDGTADPVRFAEVVGGRIGRLANKYAGVWMYSELAGVMWTGGNRSGALEVEGLLGRLSETHPVCSCIAFPVEILSWPIVIATLQQAVADQLKALAKNSTLALAIRRGPSHPNE